MTCRSHHLGRYLEGQAYNIPCRKIVSGPFHRNNHPIETQCRKQELCRYLQGQGHSMTLQQKRVRPIALLFEVGFYNFLTEIITILDDVSLFCPVFGSVRTILHYTK